MNAGWFLQAGLLDVINTLLAAGLVFTIWELPAPGLGTRPVRDFVHWGARYPFLFLVMVCLVAIIWGLVGRDYGLQGLFFDDDPGVRVLLGFATALMILSVNFHYFVLDQSTPGWGRSLKLTIATLRGLDVLRARGRAVPVLLRNGFLEELTPRDLTRIKSVLQEARQHDAHEDAGAEWRRVVDELREPAFRVQFAPAVLLADALMVLLLLGVVPLFLVGSAGWMWLFGVLVGALSSLQLACSTSRWLAQAKSWTGEAPRFRGLLDALPARSPGPDRNVSAASGRTAKDRVTAFAIAFYAVHASVATWYVPAASEVNATGILSILTAEAVAAMALAWAWKRWLRPGLRATVLGAAHLAHSRLGTMAAPLVFLRGRGLLLTTCLGTGAVAWILVSGGGVVVPLGALLFQSSYLMIWLSGFWLATAYDLRPTRPVERWAVSLAGVAGMGGLLTWSCSQYQYAVGLGLPAVVAGAVVLARRWRRGWPLVWFGVIVGFAAVLGSELSVPKGSRLAGIPCALWLAAGLLAVAAFGLSELARGKRPGMIYPVSAVFGYAAFALLYSSLPEPWQSFLPAGVSVLILFGLAASVYTVIKFHQRRLAAVTGLGVLVVLCVLNGNAWQVANNHFKLQFPNLEPYYNNLAVQGTAPDRDVRATPPGPTSLDTRAYVRSTTISVTKLFETGLQKQHNGLWDEVENERMGSVSYMLLEPEKEGPLRLGIKDPRGRFRAAVGDRVQLVLADRPHTVEAAGDGSTWVVRDLPSVPGSSSRSESESSMARCADELDRAFHLTSKGLRLWFDPPSEPGRSKWAGSVGLLYLVPEPKSDNERRYELLPGSGGSGLRVYGMGAGPLPATVSIAPRYEGINEGPLKEDEKKGGFFDAVIRCPGTELLTKIAGQYRAKNKAIGVTVLKRLLEESHLVIEQSRTEIDSQVAKHDARRALEQAREQLRTRPEGGLVPRPGGGLVLTYRSTEHLGEVPLGLGMFFDPGEWAEGRAGAFQDLGLQNAADRLADAHARTDRDQWHPGKFWLQAVHDRGVFVRTGAPGTSATFLRGDHIRPDDLLILSVATRKDGTMQRGIVQVSPAKDFVPRPPEWPAGSSQFNLKPWGGSDPSAFNSSVPTVGTWEFVRPLDNLEVLESWRQRMGPRPTGPKPPLVIVTVSGGGIRASVWTATVLKTLETRLGKEFPYHVRLITGASGGMISAAQFAASLLPPSSVPPIGPGHGTPEWDQLANLAGDQLNAVAGCMVFNDLPGMLNPMNRQVDRGRKLEETWVRLTGGAGKSPLHRPLRGLAADEREGWRPSLVFTPMMVEDGRRLLISNLDLSFVARISGRMLLEQSSRKIDPTYMEDLQPLVRPDDDILSLSAVEFYRLFPRARDFRVSTAVRMSATFPLVAPAVSLPTLPPRRVVDAGYYDNYGVNLAAQWLTKLRWWLKANTSGVIVVQVRDGVSQEARTRLDFDRDLEGRGFFERLTWGAGERLLGPGLYPLNTPLEGVSSARQWSMSFRNDEQVEQLDRLLITLNDGRPKFFRTVVFECPVPASLSWRLDEREKRWIHAGLGPRPGRDDIKDFRGAARLELDHLQIVRDNSTGDGTYRIARRRLFDQELRKLGIAETGRLTDTEAEDVYNNILNNMRRLEFLESWWHSHWYADPLDTAAPAP
jgi:hypothetical protein